MARPYTTACWLATARPVSNQHARRSRTRGTPPRPTHPAELSAGRSDPCPLPSASRCMQARTPESLVSELHRPLRADRTSRSTPTGMMEPGATGARIRTRRSCFGSRPKSAGSCNTVKSRWAAGTCCRWTGSTGPAPIWRAKAPGTKPSSSAGTPISPTRQKRSPAACAVA